MWLCLAQTSIFKVYLFLPHLFKSSELVKRNASVSFWPLPVDNACLVLHRSALVAGSARSSGSCKCCFLPRWLCASPGSWARGAGSWRKLLLSVPISCDYKSRDELAASRRKAVGNSHQGKTTIKQEREEGSELSGNKGEYGEKMSYSCW